MNKMFFNVKIFNLSNPAAALSFYLVDGQNVLMSRFGKSLIDFEEQ